MSFDVLGTNAKFGAVIDANRMIAPGDRRMSATPADGMRLAAASENGLLIEALRRSEAYLAEAQRISRTGSFGWEVSTGRLVSRKEESKEEQRKEAARDQKKKQ